MPAMLGRRKAGEALPRDVRELPESGEERNLADSWNDLSIELAQNLRDFPVFHVRGPDPLLSFFAMRTALLGRAAKRDLCMTVNIVS